MATPHKQKGGRNPEPTVDAIWKGENECDQEYMESIETFPLE